jgi:hypothetical protein
VLIGGCWKTSVTNGRVLIGGCWKTSVTNGRVLRGVCWKISVKNIPFVTTFERRKPYLPSVYDKSNMAHILIWWLFNDAANSFTI